MTPERPVVMALAIAVVADPALAMAFLLLVVSPSSRKLKYSKALQANPADVAGVESARS